MPSLLRKVGSSSLGFLAGRAIAGLAGVLLLRALGPEQGGIFGAALSFAAIFSVGATLGIDSALAGAVGRDPASAARRWSAAQVMVLAQGLVMSTLLALFLVLGGGARVPSGLVMLAFAVMVVNALGQVSAGVMQGLGQFGRQALVSTAASVTNAVGLLWLILAGAASARAALLVALATAVLGGAWWWFGRPPGLRWRVRSVAALAESWRTALPFALVTLGSLLYLKIDQALLAHLVPAASLGLYVAAGRLVDLLVPMLVALHNPLHPHLATLFSRAAAGDGAAPQQARRSLALGLRYMAVLGWPLGVGGSLLAPLIIRALYGPAFDGAGPALAWLVWVVALAAPEGVMMQAVHGLGRTALLARLAAVNLVVNVALNLWLIPRFGILASAAASVLAELIGVVVLMGWLHRRGMGLAVRGLLWPGLPAALAMGLLLKGLGLAAVAGWPAWAAVGLLVPIGAAIYAGALAALGFFGPEERGLLARLLGRPA